MLCDMTGIADTGTDGSCNLQRQLFARSERVKGIDFHPTEPWVSLPFPTILYMVLIVI